MTCNLLAVFQNGPGREGKPHRRPPRRPEIIEQARFRRWPSTITGVWRVFGLKGPKLRKHATARIKTGRNPEEPGPESLDPQAGRPRGLIKRQKLKTANKARKLKEENQ
jgi:hypothetical protein